jgi:hypothetical protein
MVLARLRDFAAYVVIAFAFAGACIWCAYHEVDFKWLGLVFQTCLVFGSAISMAKRLWRFPVFWVTIAVLAVIHLAVFVSVLSQVTHWRPVWFAILFPIESAAITVFAELVLRRSRLAKRGNRNRRHAHLT